MFSINIIVVYENFEVKINFENYIKLVYQKLMRKSMDILLIIAVPVRLSHWPAQLKSRPWEDQAGKKKLASEIINFVHYLHEPSKYRQIDVEKKKTKHENQASDRDGGSSKIVMIPLQHRRCSEGFRLTWVVSPPPKTDGKLCDLA